ncbi:unnamed protein product [Pieris macdunnoughi]|uniref:Uncharacterized protein n=1 Tax=Pieris macdunnoughi TaxID=345717 RepID=A0A821LP16_9NEOP|nr:unnamed protein product [Pieris macdunnoughi]
MIFHAKTWEQVSVLAEKGINCVSNWLQNNLLSLNLSKTKFMCFSITDRSRPTTHTCYNQYPCQCPVLEYTESIKYLGIIIDRYLTWKKHIDAQFSRIRKLMLIFNRLKRVAEAEVIRIIYLALCQSILTYCISAWGGTAESLLIKLERAQRAILKVAYRRPCTYPTVKLHLETKTLSVRKLYILATCSRYHRFRGLTIQDTSKNRRFAFPTPKRRTVFGQLSFAFRGPFLYNKISKSMDSEIVKLSRYKLASHIETTLAKLDFESTEALLHILV